MNEEKQELLEIYKLHTELADRVSQRREGANRLYVSLLASLVLFVVALLRFSPSTRIAVALGISMDTVLFWTGVLGTILTVSWYIVIRSYRLLNTGKFKALQDLERRLAYPFFAKEWELLGEGKERGRYWKLTTVEAALPCMFFPLFFGLAVFAAIR